MSLAGVVMKTILDWGKTAAGAQSVAGASSDVSSCAAHPALR